MGVFIMLFKRALMALFGFVLSFQAMASGSVLINGKDIKNRDQLRTLLVKQLGNEKTIDSLYDTLSTDFTGDSIIKIKHVNLLKAKLGSEFVEAKIHAIMDAAADNPRVILVLE